MAAKKPGRVVFIRHGESIWNVNDPRRGLVSRFTGWADIPLTAHGRRQAEAAGRCLRRFQITPDAIYTSLLRRSKDTATEIITSAGGRYSTVPIVNSWRLNERHYGALVGYPKDMVGTGLDKEEVMGWRRSWDKAPPPMSETDKRDWRNALWAKPITVITHPLQGKTIIMTEKKATIPITESLYDCALRVNKVWVNGIAPRVARGETVLVVAHANSIRSMIKCIDTATLNEKNIRGVHIPSATPLVYTFTTVKNTEGNVPATTTTNTPTSTVTSTAPASVAEATAAAIPITPAVSNKDDILSSERLGNILPLGVSSRLGMTGRYVATREIVQLNLGVVPVDEAEQSAMVGSSMFDLIDKDLTQLMSYADQDRSTSRNRAVVITDGRGVIIYANVPWQEMTGFSLDYCKGRTCKFLQGPLTSSDAADALNEKLRTGLPAKTTLINYRRDGSAFEAQLTVMPVFDWLNDPAYRPLGYSEEDSLVRNVSPQALDYGGEFSQYTAVEKDRIIMNPSHFIAKLEEIVPPPASSSTSSLYFPIRYLDEDGREFTEEEEAEESLHLYPPLTEEQMRRRDEQPGVL